MKFRVRERTDYLYIVLDNVGGLSAAELHREARRAGKFAIGYHYVVQQDGSVGEGREPYVVASRDLENSESSIYVLVDAGEKVKLLDTQRETLAELISSIQGTYPQIKVKKCRREKE